MEHLRRTLYILFALLLFSTLFSLLFPRKIRVADQIRMVAQRPLIRWMGKVKKDEVPIITLSIDEKSISYNQLEQYVEELPPGTIFFTRNKNYVISELIPSKWEHTGLYLGKLKTIKRVFGAKATLYRELAGYMDSDNLYILDSSDDGVSIRTLQSLSNLDKSSYLIHFASFSLNQSADSVAKFIERAFSYLGTDYDYDWITEDDDELFCSELIYHSFKSIGVEIERRTVTVSREIFTPDNLFDYLMEMSNSQELYQFNGEINSR